MRMRSAVTASLYFYPKVFGPDDADHRAAMQTYDLIAIGTGSAMAIVQAFLEMRTKSRIAVIDKDPPGGICLTKGCVPTKMLVYPAELIRLIQDAHGLGVEVEIARIDFKKIMKRMRTAVDSEIRQIRKGLKQSRQIDYFQTTAEFIAPYQLNVGGRTITAEKILLCTGSKPMIPSVKNLDRVKYHTSDTVLDLKKRPASLIILGGGYIAAEYGHFFSAMGTRVTIVGRNHRFLPHEEPEIGALAKKIMSRNMDIRTGHEAIEIQKGPAGHKKIIVLDRAQGTTETLSAEQILVATGRASNTDLLNPKQSGIACDQDGWIITNRYLETSQPNIWAFGDANGKHLFKHVANYEAQIVYQNAMLKEKISVDYHAVPHAVFCYPEIASVGVTELQALEEYGEGNILIGFHRYQDTTKGDAMGLTEYFVKIIVEKKAQIILGAHVIGPYASILIQEIVNLMYTRERSVRPIFAGMHIHPSLSEVIERAFFSLAPPDRYHQLNPSA